MVAVEKLEIEIEDAIISSATLPKEANSILYGLAATWTDVSDCKDLKIDKLKGAMTNRVYQVTWPTREEGALPRKVLVRLYGEGVETFFDRHDEIQTFECMSKHGQGPRLLGRFSSGRVEEFIHARTLSASDMRDPEISSLIATKLREFHDLDMPGEKNILLWNRIRSWLEAAKELCSREEFEEFHLDSLEAEITVLQNELPREDQRIGFCHNDLQYGNIMMDEDSRSLTIIDYEYASYNPVAYDMANHFCEMAADYHTETPHVLHYNKYPGFEERKRFVQLYLDAGGKSSDDEVELLLQDIQKYSLASHLLWGLWGLISDNLNEIEFNYKEYARQRFNQYWLRKHAFIGGVKVRCESFSQ